MQPTFRRLVAPFVAVVTLALAFAAPAGSQPSGAAAKPALPPTMNQARPVAGRPADIRFATRAAARGPRFAACGGSGRPPSRNGPRYSARSDY